MQQHLRSDIQKPIKYVLFIFHVQVTSEWISDPSGLAKAVLFCLTTCALYGQYIFPISDIR